MSCVGFVVLMGLWACDVVDPVSVLLTVFAGGTAGGLNLLAGPGVGITGGVDTEMLSDGAEVLDLDLSRKIALVRPDDTPMDTLTRQIGNVRKTSSIETGGWAIGTRDIGDTVSASYTNSTNQNVADIPVSKFGIWLERDTITLPAVAGGNGQPLQLVVVGLDAVNSKLRCIAVNGNGSDGKKIPDIAQGSEMIRASKAMSEKDAQAGVYTNLPEIDTNYCQIHMCQIEQSVIAKLHKTKVPFDVADYKEQAVYDMRRGMEISNWVGQKGKTFDPVKQEWVYTSAGVLNMIDKAVLYDKTALITNATYVEWCKQIFDDNNGSDTKFLFAGSNLLARMANVEGYSKQIEAHKTEVKHGVRFNVIETPFGVLYVKRAKLFAHMGLGDVGAAIDMNYLRKDIYEAMQTKELLLDESGQKRVDAQRMHETYCLVLENIPAHALIKPNV